MLVLPQLWSMKMSSEDFVFENEDERILWYRVFNNSVSEGSKAHEASDKAIEEVMKLRKENNG
jgi:hypothetical protein